MESLQFRNTNRKFAQIYTFSFPENPDLWVEPLGCPTPEVHDHGLPLTFRMPKVNSNKSYWHSRPQRPRSFWSAPESRPLARSSTGSPWFTGFLSLCACSESSLTNLIGSGLNLLCLQSHSKPECRWTGPEVTILDADQKECGLFGREWSYWLKIWND